MNFKKYAQMTLVLLATHIVSSPACGQSEHAGRGGTSAAQSVYRVFCLASNSAATAFGHSSGKIITAEHVVRGCQPKDIAVQDAQGTLSPIAKVETDEVLDLALLTPSSIFVRRPLELTTKKSFSLGMQVATWGYPEGYSGSLPLLSVGYLAGVQDIAHSGGHVRMWIVNGAFNRGNSGGPLIDISSGTVIGVISSKLAPMSMELQIKLDEIKSSGTPKEKSLAALFEHQRSQTQLVLGFATMGKNLQSFLRRRRVEP